MNRRTSIAVPATRRRCVLLRVLPLAVTLALVVPAALGAETAGVAGETRLLRFPDVHGDRIAFVYAGDVWTVEAGGGTARRLTSHSGMELFPKFSPDGRWIAFSGEYSGSRQVFVIAADGGTPRQLTFYNDVGALPPRGGWDNRILDWSPDGQEILFRANRVPWSERMGRPYVVPAAGGMERPLAIPESGGGMFSPDGKQLVYTPIDREFRTWKRYRGGRAQDVWIYDLEHDVAEQLTDSPATDNQPMWIGDTIYFTSDRESVLNLYALDLDSRAVRKVTEHQDCDVLWPSAGPDQLVYECGGYLYRFDAASERSVRVPVRVDGDRPETLPRFKNVRANVESMGLSPSGARALLTARGEVFTVPAEEGEIRNLTRTPGTREMAASWSPDGRWIAYLSDATGEYEIYLRAQDGSGEPRRLTTDGDVWRFAPVWSPDGKKLAFGDRKQRLRYVEVESGKVVEVDHNRFNDVTFYAWSPDSAWLAYVKSNELQISSIWVANLAAGKVYQLTDDLYSDTEPSFDPEGRYLYFLSDRDYNLTFSSYEPNYVYTEATRVYAGILAADGPALLRPESDEEKPAAELAKAAKAKNDKEGKEDDKEAPPVVVRIDVEGFGARVQALPAVAADYQNLQAIPGGVIYRRVGEGSPELRKFDLEEEKEELVLSGVTAYAVSRDGKKLLYRQGQTYGLTDLKSGLAAGAGQLNLDRLELRIDPRAEWQQLYTDAWRILRDWFYDPEMHGVDWQGLGQRYQQLVPHLAHRADLDFILGELGGELGAGHIYVNSGDHPRVERVEGGLLGADVVADPSGYFRIARILPGENWYDDWRSPLTEPGVNVKPGDFILAIDGVSTRGVDNVYRLLENRGGHTVTLLVSDRPDPAGAREVQVRTITSESNLRYLEWVQERRRRVEEASGGRIGYLHVPNTSFEGNRQLFKDFYPQANKQALIVDVRYNGGGFIPATMIELLDRPRLNYWVWRGRTPGATPAFGHQGPKVCLINGYSSSGGDALPYYFRRRGLGKLIGTRTWGGLIGNSANPALLDGGGIAIAAFRFLNTDGVWEIENEGVSPDIEVVDRPDLVAKGHDPALERAIAELLRELEAHPPQPVVVPPAPKRMP